MGIAALVPFAIAAIDFLEMAIPKIQEAFKSGEISADQQQKVDSKMQNLRAIQFKFTRPAGT